MDFFNPDRTDCDHLHVWRNQCCRGISHADDSADYHDQKPIGGALFYGPGKLQKNLASHHVWLFYSCWRIDSPRLFNGHQLAFALKNIFESRNTFERKQYAQHSLLSITR